MERHLSLIKTDYEELEKRVFPRFPFGFMLFRPNTANNKALEVKDISLTGMQLSCKDGEHGLNVGDKLTGELHWKGLKLPLGSKVQWVRGSTMGVAFETSIAQESKLRDFLSFENIVSHIKPLHKADLALELPNNLKYWLKSDGVLDVYVWEHTSQGISRFQILLMEHFIEWEEGVGVKTGKIMTQRDLDTPLSLEDEFTFKIDEQVVTDKVDMAVGVVSKLPATLVPSEARDFILYKLGN